MQIIDEPSLIERSSRNSDWDAAVRESVKSAITLLARSPEVTAILVCESARDGPRLDFLFDHYMKPFADLSALLLGDQRDGRTGSIDPRAALLFLFSGMTVLFAHGGLVTKLGGPAPTPRSRRTAAHHVSPRARTSRKPGARK